MGISLAVDSSSGPDVDRPPRVRGRSPWPEPAFAPRSIRDRCRPSPASTRRARRSASISAGWCARCSPMSTIASRPCGERRLGLVRPTGFLKTGWAVVFLDDADQPGALAYHDLTPEGLPLSKVFVRTTIQNGDLVSVSASHELVEMLVDPAINMMTTGPDSRTM